MSERLVSPIVNEDRSIAFNLKSENAKKVEIDGDLRFGRERVGPHKPVPSVSMKKTKNRVWTHISARAQWKFNPLKPVYHL